jgi:hypothetical protein
MKRIYGLTKKYCPVHGWTNFQIFAIDDDEECVSACKLCLQEAEEYLLQDTA